MKLICTLPNASSLINGINFIKHEAGVISEEITEEVAALFAGIAGYITEEEHLLSKTASEAKGKVVATVKSVSASVVGKVSTKKSEPNTPAEPPAPPAPQTAAPAAPSSGTTEEVF